MDGRRFTWITQQRDYDVSATDGMLLHEVLDKFAINEQRTLEIILDSLKKPGAYHIYGTDIFIRTE